ncbi:MAG: MlaD family protein [Pseudomonadota bacterium]|nr:MlaD family protein [Pseudomonadota bacterium]
MADTKDPSGGMDPIPEVVVEEKRRISIVWLIPLVAVVIGAWLVYKAVSEKGPVITITFNTASGLEAGKTKIKFKDVEVGKVGSVTFGKDLSKVVVTAELNREMRKYLRDSTRFWVVTARVAAGEVTGLSTLLSGAFIGMDPGTGGESMRDFVGLEKAPVVIADTPGTRFVLRSKALGSIEAGSPVYYRRIRVGEVESYELEEDGEDIVFKVFVYAPHDRLVHENTRFWNASGIDVSLNADGFRLETESLVSLLIGGVAFDTPSNLEAATRAAPGREFQLYRSREATKEREYQRKEYYLVYFDGSVRGLKVGAPVMIRGIDVGKVVDMSFQFDVRKVDFEVPVLIEIEPDRIKVVGLEPGEVERKMAEELVARGLRAQLRSGNILTGQLMVDLDFHPDAPPATIRTEGEYAVLPSVPATIDQLRLGLHEILRKIQDLPLEKIAGNLNDTLAGTSRLVNSDEVAASVRSLNATLVQTERLATGLSDDVLPELEGTLRQARSAMQNVDGLLRADSPAYNELMVMMKELSGAARSIRMMASYLERHPEALIKGKSR